MDDAAKVKEDVKRLFGNAPDCRAKFNRGQIRTPMGLATPYYCANCGEFAGYVVGAVEGFFYLCNGCDKHGTGLDLPIVDEATVRAIETKEEAGPCSTTT